MKQNNNINTNVDTAIRHAIGLLNNKVPELDLRKVILFGSYARGNYTDYSDIDILILADGSTESINAEYFWKVIDNISETNLEHNVFISPILESTESYEKSKETNPLYINIEKEGVLYYGR